MTTRAAHELIKSAPRGLACARGGFHIDPWKAVPLAVISHAHADHARLGSGQYLCTPDTAAILRVRLSPGITTRELEYGETIELGHTRVSLHPAGHVLGSAQVRIEDADTGETWVVTGDYKTEADRTCVPFEPVPCDTLLTESTFGLPIYRWAPESEVAIDINSWWRSNADRGDTSVIFAYSLGKAQRVLSLLDPGIGPIGEHGASHKITQIYRDRDVLMPDTMHATKANAPMLRGTGLIVAPPSVSGTPWLRQFNGSRGMRTAFASGWMRVRGRRRWQSVDRGFTLSDHADWNGLLSTIRASGCNRVGTTHGFAEPFARYVTEVLGLDSFVVPTRYVGENDGTDGDARADESPDTIAADKAN